MDPLAATMLQRSTDNAEHQLAQTLDAIQRHVDLLASDPTATSVWGNLAHDVAEGANLAGQIKAFRDAAALAGAR